LREREHGHPFAFELLRGLAEAPGVEDDLLQSVAEGEVADLVDAVEDAGVAVVDGGADVEVCVDPDDRAC
jgi:hypothetical protein